MQNTIGILGHPTSRRSLPGEPPRVENNRLRTSISSIPSRREGVVRVGTSVPYGRHLEYGTRRIAPRPWVLRSYTAARDKMNAVIQNAIRESVRKAVSK
jgi:hypothetical protein